MFNLVHILWCSDAVLLFLLLLRYTGEMKPLAGLFLLLVGVVADDPASDDFSWSVSQLRTNPITNMRAVPPQRHVELGAVARAESVVLALTSAAQPIASRHVTIRVNVILAGGVSGRMRQNVH